MATFYIVLAATIIGPIVLAALLLVLSYQSYVAMAVALVLVSPLFLWHCVVISAKGTTVWSALLIVPYWITRVPARAKLTLYEAWEDPAPSGITYDWDGKEVLIGNGWNAHALLAVFQRIEDTVRSNKSLERTREG